MEERIRQLLEQIPEKPPRSVLQPHVHLIRQLRRKRLTYRAIARLLQAECGVSVHWTTIHSFLKVRARRRCDEVRPKYELAEERPAVVPNEGQRAATFGALSAAPPRTPAEMYAHYEELKRRKSTPPPPPSKPVFHYEEGEPLRLITDADELEKSTALLEKLRKGRETGSQ